MEAMKQLNLKQGYYVSEWDGKITPVSYTIVDYLGIGRDTKIVMFNEEGHLLELEYEHKKVNILDTMEDAERMRAKTIQKRIDYYKEQIEDHKESIKELMKGIKNQAE